MELNKTRIRQLLKEFNFRFLFNELGWDHYNSLRTVSLLLLHMVDEPQILSLKEGEKSQEFFNTTWQKKD